jgi:hypothetical protein
VSELQQARFWSRGWQRYHHKLCQRYLWTGEMTPAIADRIAKIGHRYIAAHHRKEAL